MRIAQNIKSGNNFENNTVKHGFHTHLPVRTYIGQDHLTVNGAHLSA